MDADELVCRWFLTRVDKNGDLNKAKTHISENECELRFKSGPEFFVGYSYPNGCDTCAYEYIGVNAFIKCTCEVAPYSEFIDLDTGHNTISLANVISEMRELENEIGRA